MTSQTIIHGKCEEVLQQYADNTFDSCVTDPPYGISFMNKHWDYSLPSVETWKEIFRVLKPGAHILVACGTRTQHRMAVNIEDAGFQIRDVITWHYGSGFPKSRDISKAIDKMNGAERQIVGTKITGADKPNGKGTMQLTKNTHKTHDGKTVFNITAPATEAAKQWEGWGTALKPATEFFTLARKPLIGTVAENVLKYGTGGLNIDDCRIEFKNDDDKNSAIWGRGTDILSGNYVGATHGNGKENIEPNNKGRFPANLILDEFAAAELDKQAPTAGAFAPVAAGQNGKSNGIYGDFANKGDNGESFYADSGGASRFFYCAKADTFERNKGLKEFDSKPIAGSNQAKAELKRGNMNFESDSEQKSSCSEIKMRKNNHPTVKPIDLMRYLVKLITPKGAHVLDPFNGSGTTGIAAKLELMNYTGIELDEEYCNISKARIAAWNPEKYKPQTLF